MKLQINQLKVVNRQLKVKNKLILKKTKNDKHKSIIC